MKKAIIWGGTIILVSVVVTLIVVFRFQPSFDPQKVYPEVRRITEPLEMIHLSYHTDGGSRSIHIRDNDNREYLFMLPHPMGNPAFHGTLFEGDYFDGTQIDETVYPDTRTALFRMIERSESRRNDDAGGTLYRLTTDRILRARLMLRHHLGYYNIRS